MPRAHLKVHRLGVADERRLVHIIMAVDQLEVVALGPQDPRQHLREARHRQLAANQIREAVHRKLWRGSIGQTRPASLRSRLKVKNTGSCGGGSIGEVSVKRSEPREPQNPTKREEHQRHLRGVLYIV
eukprot:7514606-Pyramimonas_sp.AAC.1